ncbi:hypothetical protein [Vibrio coralliirubri]|uniref:hypothetical protein n=1 Tax=Vibrio coralliirubri TaxID=1516159 RepID=UPI000AB507B6|nr:hypothetical protein [Vibrio coralliirubri]
MKVYKLALVLVMGWSQMVNGSECQPSSGYEHWNTLNKTSTELGEMLLKAKDRGLTESEQKQVTTWLERLERSAEEVDRTLLLNQENSATHLMTKFQHQTEVTNVWPLFGVRFDKARHGSGSPDELYLEDTSPQDGDVLGFEVDTIANSQRCASEMKCLSPENNANACRLYLDGWASAVSTYKDPIVQVESKIISGLALAYGKEWDNYFDNARSQTFLDRMVTAGFNRKELTKKEFALPPKLQYFLFHPNALLEYVDDASDGNQFKAALAVEWFGINAWRSCLGANFGCGASIVSTYSDRAGVDDFGHGVMLHINNSYSLGVTTRDGDIGYFVTVDLLKIFEDKKSEAIRWQQTANKLLNNQ